ncbi:MAG: ATP-grasp domain-containing protein, partial [Spirochaetia bacterium]|nr:ATP-grasp domain-containing protein [Spirochaetia bacterium]
MSSQYYLSLGTGIHQLPLIEAAKKLKLKVIGVDQNAQSPGMAICDLKIQESIYNYRKIFYKINSLLIDGEIVGGYSASFGKALLSWSYLAEKLRVGGISRPLMERLLDKYEVRKMLSEVHIKAPSFSQPKFIAGRSGIVKKQLNDIKGGFHAPYIVKPRSGWGKKDIYEIDDVKHFRELFGKKNLIENGILPSSFIIEEKIEGDEITVTGLVQNFCFIPVCVTDKIT